jgi:hypothetical protein
VIATPTKPPVNLHEQAFVEAFIDPRRRERFLEALAHPKRRKLFRDQLCHPHSNFLRPEYIESIAPSQQHARLINLKLRSLGAPDLCWVFGNHIDGRDMNLEAALDQLVGKCSGIIVSCLPGKIAFLESEEARVILHRS